MIAFGWWVSGRLLPILFCIWYDEIGILTVSIKLCTCDFAQLHAKRRLTYCHCSLKAARDMSTSESAQRLSLNRLDMIYAFRSITTFIRIIDLKSASRTASDLEPNFYFTNTPNNNLTSTERQQFRINTALAVCAVRDQEVLTVLSSRDKTAGISNSYIYTVNPRSASGKPLDDVLYYRTTGSDDAMPHLVSGKGQNLGNASKFIRTYMWVWWMNIILLN